MTEILYSLAKNSNGVIIPAKNAKKGLRYFCITCNNEMILKKSEKGLRRPHFSHKSLVSNCTAETALHMGFKELLYDKIKVSLDQNKELKMEWKCNLCHDNHSGNLIKKTKDVRKEYSFGVCRPDISLLNESGKLIIAIEVVVTHEPEKNTIQFYKENKVILIKFNLSSDSDIDLLNNDTLFPDYLEVCPNPKCTKCGGSTAKKYMYIMRGKCWKCKYPMTISSVYSNYGSYSAEAFNQEEIAFATKHGATISKQHLYNAHACLKCKNFIGAHYVWNDYLVNALYKNIPFDSHDIGYTCIYCDY
jgi:hypothetical protein